MILAYQLALSEMFNSPILMVDEGFTGLEESTRQTCLEMLKPISERKLVLVVEHGAPKHLFDEVINI